MSIWEIKYEDGEPYKQFIKGKFRGIQKEE